MVYLWVNASRSAALPLPSHTTTGTGGVSGDGQVMFFLYILNYEWVYEITICDWLVNHGSKVYNFSSANLNSSLDEHMTIKLSNPNKASQKNVLIMNNVLVL